MGGDCHARGLEDEVMGAAEKIYKELLAEGVEVLFDDRDAAAV
jgi:prolyl-tRNA synthetase